MSSDGSGGTMEISRTRVMGMLHAQVPLSLLYDLVDPTGPQSAEIMAVEAGRLDPLATDFGRALRRC